MVQTKFRFTASAAAVALLLLITLAGSSTEVASANTDGNERRVVCYYTNWSVYRPGNAKFTPQNINPYLCTHLIYAFGGFTKDNTLKPFDKYQDIEQGGYAKFTGLKTYNKKLKTLLAIGGWNEASGRFSPLVSSVEKRTTFIKNIIKFLRQNHFDGLDLDWEYPAFRDGGKPADRKNYAQFVQELAEEMKRESSKTGRPRLLLTMAVPAGIEYIEKGYDIPKLNQYLDWFNLLTYDYHSAFEPSVNHHAPLYSLVDGPDEYNYDSELNIDYTIKHYINQGADRQKLVLGIPTYGRSYTLFNPEANELGSPTDGPGEQGDATREKGYLAYYEICQRVREEEWTVVSPNEKAMGPYAYKDNQWVGYDDEEIARKKAMYVLENDLGGVMFWSIDNDDFRGSCTGKPFPIIEAAKETLLQDVSSGNYLDAKPVASKRTTTVAPSVVTKSAASLRRKNRPRRPTQKPSSTARYEEYTRAPSPSVNTPTTSTPQPPTTPDSGTDFKCEDEGFFPHPRDCKKYFWCLDSGPSELGIVAHQFTCPSGLYFNKLADSCDYTRNVVCSKPKQTTTTTTAAPRSTASTTTRAPRTTVVTAVTPKRNYASIRPILRTTTPTTTTTTTTEAYEEYLEEDDEEYEEDGGADGSSIGPSPADLESEDPKVIKELIDLIKKVGGIEELEKQLKQNHDGTHVLVDPNQTTLTTTPPSIPQKLYEKILRKPILGVATKEPAVAATVRTDSPTTVSSSSGSNQLPKYSSIYRATSNSRPGPQNFGLDKFTEAEGLRNEKPQYITITRNRPQTSPAPVKDVDVDLLEEDDGEEEEEAASFEEVSVARSTEPTFVRYTIPEHVEVTGHDETYRVSGGGVFDGQTQQSPSTPYVTIYRTTTPKAEATTGTAVKSESGTSYQTIKRGQPNHGTRQDLSPPPVQYEYNLSSNEEEQQHHQQQEDPRRTAVSTVSPNQDRSPPVVASDSVVTRTLNTPKYTTLNRPRTRPDGDQTLPQTTNNDWTSSISFDTENILNGLKFRTNSLADQIRIRVTATTESMRDYDQHDDTDDIANHDSAMPSVTINGEPQQLGGGEQKHVIIGGNSGVGTDQRTNIMSTSTITNPIKLIITTSGQNQHNHNQQPHYDDSMETLTSLYPDSAPGYDHDTDMEDMGDAYVLNDGIDLASLLAHHEANLANDISTHQSQGPSHNRTLKNEHEGSPQPSLSLLVPNEPLIEIMMSESTGEVEEEGDYGMKYSNKNLPKEENNLVGGYGMVGGGVGDGGVLVEEDAVKVVKERPHHVSVPTTTTVVTTPRSSTSNIISANSVITPTVGYRKRMRVPATQFKRTTTTTESPPKDNEINNQVKLRTRPLFRHASASTTTAVPNTTPATQSTVPFFRKRTRPAILSGSTTTSSTTTRPSTSNQPPRLVLRKKIYRSTSSTTAAPNEETRVRSEVASTNLSSSINDQELGSSITQENKFLNNRFNQIGESVGAAIQAISKAPLPVSIATTTKQYKPNKLYAIRGETALDTGLSTLAPTTISFLESTTTPTLPPLHKRLKIKKIVTRPQHQKIPEFVTATTTTTERQFNKPILIMTNERPAHRNRERPKPFEKISSGKPVLDIENSSPGYELDIPTTPKRVGGGISERPHFDYDYYDESDDQFIGKIRAQVKVILHGNGSIECLDQGNFPHPLQCKKFISCAKMEPGGLIGWEYTCPRGLSYDPVGGICNWAAGLGCKEN